MSEHSWPKVSGNSLMGWWCIWSCTEWMLCDTNCRFTFMLSSKIPSLFTGVSESNCSQFCATYFGANVPVIWHKSLVMCAYQSFAEFPILLEPSMRLVTSFLLHITELGFLPWLRIIRFRFTQFSIKLPLLELVTAILHIMLCALVSHSVSFLSPATAAVDDIYYLLGGGFSTSVGRYAKERESSSGPLPSNVSNPQWRGIEVPCVGISLLGHWL